MFNQVANRKDLEAVAEALNKRHFNAEIVSNKAAALAKLIELMPEGAQVMTASSTSLNEIGFTDYLASKESKFDSVHEKINQEDDAEKRNLMRRHAVAADYFLASPNAVTRDGLIVAVDATGSRVGAMPFAAGKLVLIVGAQKITEDLDEAMKRIKEYVFPLEDKRSQAAYGAPSSFGKWVILENEVNPDRIKVILVEEALGY